MADAVAVGWALPGVARRSRYALDDGREGLGGLARHGEGWQVCVGRVEQPAFGFTEVECHRLTL